MPAGGGDPTLEKLDGQEFAFRGTHGRRYNLLTLGDLKLYGRVGEVGEKGREGNPTCFIGLDLYLPAGATIRHDRSHGLAVACGEWEIAVTRKLCTFPAM